MISKAQVMALAVKGCQFAPVRTAGAAREPPCGSHWLALIESGSRVLFTRTTDLVQKFRLARWELNL